MEWGGDDSTQVSNAAESDSQANHADQAAAQGLESHLEPQSVHISMMMEN